MATGNFGAVLDDIQVLFSRGTSAGLTDVERIGRLLADGGAGASRRSPPW
jgi:hypothetical protein